jgi:hypothetical protein
MRLFQSIGGVDLQPVMNAAVRASTASRENFVAKPIFMQLI